MVPIALTLRWSWRDLRRRWTVVGALGLVIAIGTGTAAAFGNMSHWRRVSNDASFAAMGMHDLQINFDQQPIDPAAARDAIARIPHAALVRAVQPRIDLPTQVEVTSDGRRVVAAGRIVGVDLGAEPDVIDRVEAVKGRALTTADAAPESQPAPEGQPSGRAVGPAVALIEMAFAKQYRLPVTGSATVAGNAAVDLVGWGRSPQYLMNGNGAWLGEPIQAALFTPLATAQRLAGTPGRVNQILVGLVAGADRATVAEEISAALRTALPGSPATVADREADPTYRILYEDIDNDQVMWNVVSILILSGAALATFNLASRVIAAQRMEFGVGAALGLRTPALAMRPLLFGAQVAVLGAVAGLGVGALLGWAITGVLDDLLPLPIWRTPFQPGSFVKAAVLGAAIPMAGVVYPVVRAVRMPPAEAIRTVGVAVGGSRLGRRIRSVPLPGSSIAHLPVRHLLRAPGRTAMTAAGVGAAITVLVAMLGLIDSFDGSFRAGAAEQRRTVPDRIVVGLDQLYPVDAPELATLRALPQVDQAQPALRIEASASTGDGRLDLMVDLMDFRTSMWAPTMRPAPKGQGAAGVPDGIVLAAKAADDLGVRVGDTIDLEHPRLLGDSPSSGMRMVTSRIRVAAVHPHPLRTLAYLDSGQAELLGATGLTNLVQIRPTTGIDREQLRRQLAGLPAVRTVTPISTMSDGLRDMMAQFVDLLRILAGFVLLLALLIAFNAASISADERRREHATMFAFGLGTRTVLRNAMVESVLVGLLGTAIGLVLGVATVHWVNTGLMPSTLPEVRVNTTLTAESLLIAVLVGVLAVAVAPLLTVRRLHRTNVPATLRVVE